ncbi:EamA family transporter [uncultured Amnibacterium sp.]|uniref:EamA family transporter n=1 Tax=uncultured Amnibacterium sp. TaxID=1631851 RepID=UPI0035CB992C
MSVVLALAGALLYGLGDFCGGLASRRAATLAVVAASQLASVVVLAPALLLIPARFDWPSVVWGAAAGVVGVTGLLLFYRGLALGAMTVVAPLTALASAAVPVLAGLLLGDRPSAVAFAGVGLALVGVVLISAQGGRLPGPRLLASAATLTALGAGLAFGLLFVLLSRADADTGMWPLAGARTASLLVLAALAVVRRASVVPRGAPPALVVTAGLGDMGANVLFLLASRVGC